MYVYILLTDQTHDMKVFKEESDAYKAAATYAISTMEGWSEFLEGASEEYDVIYFLARKLFDDNEYEKVFQLFRQSANETDFVYDGEMI